MLQFDWFHSITEKWGQVTSDMVVREISDVVRKWKRDSDVFGRVGEDRFAIIFVGVKAVSAQAIVNTLRDEIDEACNERMSGLLKFTISSSILDAQSGTLLGTLMRKALIPLGRAGKLGANISFVNGVYEQHLGLGAANDATFMAHG
ncbi:hypothetical protein EH31_09175 [Erythrobacter longus]|uniref:GGDEF domain-containing protein n=1 Tax=Erythrobacter longus TaxID=1044 RepID=A0A074M692_ERYLO|nr:hypothetical protein EH31_09175 [Erythrobacter longus]